MSNEFVSLKQLAAEIGMDRSHARRYVLRLGITPHKRRTPDSANQLTLALTQEEANRVRSQRREQGFVMDALTAERCRLISNEVFECDDLAQLIAKGDTLFATLPTPASRPELADVSLHNT